MDRHLVESFLEHISFLDHFPSFICLHARCLEVARLIQYPELPVKLRNYLTSSQHAMTTEQFASQSAPTSKPSPNPCVTLEVPYFLALVRGSRSSKLKNHARSYCKFEDQPQG